MILQSVLTTIISEETSTENKPKEKNLNVEQDHEKGKIKHSMHVKQFTKCKVSSSSSSSSSSSRSEDNKKLTIDSTRGKCGERKDILNGTKDQKSNLEESKRMPKRKQYALNEISRTSKDHKAIKGRMWSLETPENKMQEGRKGCQGERIYDYERRKPSSDRRWEKGLCKDYKRRKAKGERRNSSEKFTKYKRRKANRERRDSSEKFTEYRKTKIERRKKGIVRRSLQSTKDEKRKEKEGIVEKSSHSIKHEKREERKRVSEVHKDGSDATKADCERKGERREKRKGESQVTKKSLPPNITNCK